MLRAISFLLAVAAALPLLTLVSLAAVTPITRWGWLYLVGGTLMESFAEFPKRSTFPV